MIHRTLPHPSPGRGPADPLPRQGRDRIAIRKPDPFLEKTVMDTRCHGPEPSLKPMFPDDLDHPKRA